MATITPSNRDQTARLANPAPANRHAKRRRSRAPIDDSVTAVVFRTKATDKSLATWYVRNARKASDTWYPLWTTDRSAARKFAHQDALDLLGWLKKSSTVDRSFIYQMERVKVEL